MRCWLPHSLANSMSQNISSSSEWSNLCAVVSMNLFTAFMYKNAVWARWSAQSLSWVNFYSNTIDNWQTGHIGSVFCMPVESYRNLNWLTGTTRIRLKQMCTVNCIFFVFMWGLGNNDDGGCCGGMGVMGGGEVWDALRGCVCVSVRGGGWVCQKSAAANSGILLV